MCLCEIIVDFPGQSASSGAGGQKSARKFAAIFTLSCDAILMLQVEKVGQRQCVSRRLDKKQL